MILRGMATVGLALAATLGAGAVLAGPVAWRTARPIVKAALITGLRAAASARTAVARAAEDVEDLIAEVRHELREAEAGDAGGDGRT